MKSRLIITGLFFLCLGNVFSQKIKLTDDAKSMACIVIPAKADTTIQFASKELQDFIKKITGAQLTISSIPQKQNNIFIGKSYVQGKYADDLKFLTGNDGYAVRNDGKNIFIFGECSKGTLNGVYSFLGKNTDIIFARAGEQGTIYSKAPTLEIQYAAYREKPVFSLRGWHICAISKHSDLETELWMIRNRCNWVGSSHLKCFMERRIKHGFMLQYGGGHNLKTFISTEKYFKKHPEYFCQLDSKRRPVKNNQLCFTNDEMIKDFTKELLEKIKDNPEYNDFSIMTEDNWNVCECPECRKPVKLADGSILKPDDKAFRSTQFFIFLNKIAKEVYKKYPDKKITTLAYMFTTQPPKVKIFKTINICFCPYVKNDKESVTGPSNKKWKDRTEKWTKTTPNIVWREYYGCASKFPRPLARMVALDLRYINKSGIDKVYSEYIPDCEIINKKHGNLSWSWDVSAMEFWIISNLFWNPYQDVSKLRQQFISRTFHKAAPGINKFYNIIIEAWYSDPMRSHFNDSDVKSAVYYILKKGHEKSCRQALEQAAKAARAPKVKALVSRIRKRFECWMTEARKNSTPSLTVPFIKNASQCDFNFGSPVWRKAARISELKVMKQPGQASKYPTSIWIMHDRKNLYIGFKCSDNEPGKIYARPKSSEEAWTKGDHCEMYFDGDRKTKGSYYHLCFDFSGNKYDASGFDRNWNGKWKVNTKVLPDGWKAVAVISLESLGVNISQENKLKALFYRLFSHNSKEQHEHSSWNGCAVHQAAGFGELTLNIE